MPHQPNSLPQAQHLRRESSQSAHSDMSNSMNRGYSQNGGRGRGFAPQHYQQPSPQPYRSVPNTMGGRGSFHPQNSPYLQNRSPAIPPATMSMYQGQYQQYPQHHVSIPSISNLSSVSESNVSLAPTTASRSRSFHNHSANSKVPEVWASSKQPNACIKPVEPHFSSSTCDFELYLTKMPDQNMYGMPQQSHIPYDQGMYPGYGLQQSIYAGIPNSPGRVPGFPQQPYGVPGPYGGQPQAQGMSRTPSNISERPSSAIPAPSTPAMMNVNSHANTPSVTAASPAPSSSTFERPKKQSKAIVIKTGM